MPVITFQVMVHDNTEPLPTISNAFTVEVSERDDFYFTLSKETADYVEDTDGVIYRNYCLFKRRIDGESFPLTREHPLYFGGFSWDCDTKQLVMKRHRLAFGKAVRSTLFVNDDGDWDWKHSYVELHKNEPRTLNNEMSAIEKFVLVEQIIGNSMSPMRFGPGDYWMHQGRCPLIGNCKQLVIRYELGDQIKNITNASSFLQEGEQTANFLIWENYRNEDWGRDLKRLDSELDIHT